MPDYGEIIKRLEEASGPSPELDGRIYCAVNGLTFRSVSRDGSIHFEPDENGTHTMVTPHPYTESIDTSATLCPAGHDWSLYVDNGEAVAGCMPASEDGCDVSDSHGATPAIALCLAFLRARSTMEESNG